MALQDLVDDSFFCMIAKQLHDFCIGGGGGQVILMF